APPCAGGRAGGNGCDGRRAGLVASAEPVVSWGIPGSAFMMLTAGIEDADGKNRLLGLRALATGADDGDAATGAAALAAAGTPPGQAAAWRLTKASKVCAAILALTRLGSASSAKAPHCSAVQPSRAARICATIPKRSFSMARRIGASTEPLPTGARFFPPESSVTCAAT